MGKLPGFTIYPGDWRGSKWITYEMNDRDRFSGVLDAPGVYVFYVDDELVYVGSSVRLRHRVNEYGYYRARDGNFVTNWQTNGWKVWVKVRYSDKYGDWLMRELRLIRRLEPPGNVKHSRKRRGPKYA